MPLEVTVYERRLIGIKYAQDMKNNAALVDLVNYSISPDLPIRELYTKDTDSTDIVYAVVNRMTEGVEYTLSIQASNLLQVDNTNPTETSGKFVGRSTKVDHILEARPILYNNDIRTLQRSIINAIGNEDELIGGSRDDRI